MLGILRFFLASCVIVFHLTAQVPNIGQLSVNLFYVISGYLITLILNESYKFKLKAFAFNRALRLYPTYYVFAILSLLLNLIPIDGVSSSVFHTSWSGGQQPLDIFGNALIFPWAFLSDQSVLSIPGFLYSDAPRFRLIPSTWSIGVELVCYAILFLISARSLSLSVITLLASITYHIFIQQSSFSTAYNYFPFFAAMLPFSIGAIGYFASRSIESKFGKINISYKSQTFSLFILIAIFITNWMWSKSSSDLYTSISYYVNNFIGLSAVMLFHGASTPVRIKWISKVLGDLSYPMFLVQYVAGYIGWQIIGQPDNIRGWNVFVAGYVVSIMLSIVILVIIDRPIQNLRSKIRPK